MKKEWTGWNIWRLRKGGWQALADRLIEEAPVCLVLGAEEAANLMATPGLERELGAGFAITMGLVDRAAQPGQARWDAQAGEVRLEAAGNKSPGLGIKAVGGGPLGPEQAEPLSDQYTLELEQVLGFTDTLLEGQTLFAQTSASHAVALFDGQGELRFLAEDAGRHNALDKAVGLAWLAGELQDMRAAAFSGRMSLEMVLKAARAGLALLVSVSAPSAPAVESAQRLGVTLAGFARKGGLNIYCHPERIVAGGGALDLTPKPGPAGE